MAETNETQKPAEGSQGADQAGQPQGGQQARTSGESNQDARMWAMFCHLGGLVGFAMPFGNIIAPLILWQLKKNEYPFADSNGKEALNFQISMTIYSLISIPLCFICIGMLLIPAIVVADVILLIIAAIRANDGQLYRYPLCIRFIK
jgi:uncharacterized Tic20 family protein